jgi:hypothetical protein
MAAPTITVITIAGPERLQKCLRANYLDRDRFISISARSQILPLPDLPPSLRFGAPER